MTKRTKKTSRDRSVLTFAADQRSEHDRQVDDGEIEAPKGKGRKKVTGKATSKATTEPEVVETTEPGEPPAAPAGVGNADD